MFTLPNLTDAFNWAVDTCNDPMVRYNQDYRNAQKDPQGYTCYDCASFVNYFLLAGGWETPRHAPNNNPCWTGNQVELMLSLGFVEVNASGDILPGDIGWNSQHTEIAYSSGSKGVAVWMGAHGRDGGAIPSEHQVSIGSTSGDKNWTRSFARVFRYEGAPVTKGPSLYVVSAIAGNMIAESGINPGIYESLRVVPWDATYNSNTGGYGLGQWTNVGNSRGRLWNLYSFLSSSGYEVDSGEGQVAYIPVENYWTPRDGYPWNTLDEFLNSDSTDLNLLTGAWNRCWEGIPLSIIRYQYAQRCYDYISANMNNSSITNWIRGNRYLSEAEQNNNAVMLYRALGGIVGEGSGVPDSSGENPGDIQANPELPNWFDMFAMTLGGNKSTQKLHVKRRR